MRRRPIQKTTDVKIISMPPAQPAEVKIIEAPAPPLEMASEKEARLSHDANEQDLTAYTRILAWATGGLVVVAMLQAALFFWQLVYMRKALKDASISADAARDGALAANQLIRRSALHEFSYEFRMDSAQAA